jgi:hypothetical protein
MKYAWETEEQFLQRYKEAKRRGECVFRDDNNRELVLDLIDNYIDVVEIVTESR